MSPYRKIQEFEVEIKSIFEENYRIMNFYNAIKCERLKKTQKLI